VALRESASHRPCRYVTPERPIVQPVTVAGRFRPQNHAAVIGAHGAANPTSLSRGVLRTDPAAAGAPIHGRMIWGETGRPGYGLYDRALGVTYLQGSMGSAFPERHVSTAAAPRRIGYRWTVCALLFVVTTINYVDRQVLGILAPTLQHDLGWSRPPTATSCHGSACRTPSASSRRGGCSTG